MVGAEELRIGNYVLKDGMPIPTIARDIYRISNGLTTREPIPLTEEVAKKCGFKEQDKLGKGIWLILDHIIWFQFINGEVKMWVGKEKALVCKYLHDLQNLVFWHTRIELEVKL